MKNITLGQYYAVDSPIHRLDPRIKIVIAILYIVITFLSNNISSMALLLISALAIILVSKIPVKLVLKSVRAIVFIIAFTAIINIFLWKEPEAKPLLDLGFVKIYTQGVINAVFLIVRIIVLIIGSSVLLTYTTTPIALTDGIERILSPLKKIGLPVHDFAMIMTIALRFIPTLMEEADKIMSAQKARGADFTNGSLIQRAKALIPILIPLFSSSIRHALDLATAMECRCYKGGEGRTRMKVLKCRASDIMALILIVAFGASVFCVSKFVPF